MFPRGSLLIASLGPEPQFLLIFSLPASAIPRTVGTRKELVLWKQLFIPRNLRNFRRFVSLHVLESPYFQKLLRLIISMAGNSRLYYVPIGYCNRSILIEFTHKYGQQVAIMYMPSPGNMEL